MRDLAGAILSVALPWVAGTLWVRALWRGEQDRRGALSVGYGYFVGAFATTLVMRLVDLAGQRWNLAWVAVPLLALAAAAWFSVKPQRSLRKDWRRALAGLAGIAPASRRLFWLFLALCAINAIAIAAFVALSLLISYDAMAQWADKSRVWYEYGRLLPFVGASDWYRLEDALHFWDPNPTYPGTVPLLQVWTALCLGHWDESLINIAWVAAFVALGFAFYGQMRRLDTGPVKSIACTYLLLSLPFLQVHVVLAGMVDIFVAAVYGLAAMSFWQWVLARQRQDALLALAMVIVCAALKREGALWALTFAPALVVAVRHRTGLALAALLGIAAVGYALFGPAELRFMGYVVRAQFEHVMLPIYQHLFLMDNWHLLWYAAIAVIAFNWRLLLQANFAAVTVTMLAALGFVSVVFFYSSAASAVVDESLLNRFLLHLAPALAFFLVLLLQERDRRLFGAPNEPAAAAARLAT
jgi:hypothetical protein